MDTITTSGGHGLQRGDRVVISGTLGRMFDGVFVVGDVTATTVKVRGWPWYRRAFAAVRHWLAWRGYWLETRSAYP